jgi:hypothetical protein
MVLFPATLSSSAKVSALSVFSRARAFAEGLVTWMSGCLRADDSKRCLLHVDGKARFPDRQAEKCLVIRDRRRVELRLLGKKPVFGARIDRISLRRETEILQLLGFRSYKRTKFPKIFLRSKLRGTRGADDRLLVSQIARDSLGVAYDLRPRRFIKFFEHHVGLP